MEGRIIEVLLFSATKEVQGGVQHSSRCGKVPTWTWRTSYWWGWIWSGQARCTLESGALDRSATPTARPSKSFSKLWYALWLAPKKVNLSEVGFEPTPTYVDQKAQPELQARCTLESGALDHSATLTAVTWSSKSFSKLLCKLHS